MNLVRIIREHWWSKQRAIDLKLLWPICKRKSRSLDEARAVFACHAFNDPCWIKFYGEERLKEVIGALR